MPVGSCYLLHCWGRRSPWLGSVLSDKVWLGPLPSSRIIDPLSLAISEAYRHTSYSKSNLPRLLQTP